MNSKIINEWINNKVKVAVILNHKYFNGFNNTAYIHTTGIIKESDNIGILYENKKKDIFYIPYTSIIEIELLNIDKKRLKMNFDIKDVKSWANRHDVKTLSVTGFLEILYQKLITKLEDTIKEKKTIYMSYIR